MQHSKAGKVGGPCEGCEAIYESSVPFEQLNEVDTLPLFNEPGPRLVISGRVLQADGKTPAAGVVLYVYQTDQTGRYRVTGNECGWASRHGTIRGWMKTNERGEYRFYTVRPAAYSKTGPPAHIHITVKEPDKNEYWIDDFHFDDDPLLTKISRMNMENRGGNGIIRLRESGGVFYGVRNIQLGKNIPHYPKTGTANLQSGLQPGENCPAFDPFHVSGADVNASACPMCKYGYGQGVMVWFKDQELKKMDAFAQQLEAAMARQGAAAFRVFLVYIHTGPASREEEKRSKEALRNWCAARSLKNIAVVWVPSLTDAETTALYRINPAADNTVLVYRKRKVAAKWVNMEYHAEAVKAMLRELDIKGETAGHLSSFNLFGAIL